jgi:hypothetical protein
MPQFEKDDIAVKCKHLPTCERVLFHFKEYEFNRSKKDEFRTTLAPRLHQNSDMDTANKMQYKMGTIRFNNPRCTYSENKKKAKTKQLSWTPLSSRCREA